MDDINKYLLDGDEGFRPRRSCAKKEGDFKEEIIKFSDDSCDEIIVDKNDDKDEEYKLGGAPRKRKKKGKKLKKRKSEKPAVGAPSFLSVVRAHQNFEKKFEAEDDYEDSSGDEDESEPEMIQQPNKQRQYSDNSFLKRKEQSPPRAPPMKKKKIPIRPWNPGWYHIPN